MPKQKTTAKTRKPRVNKSGELAAVERHAKRIADEFIRIVGSQSNIVCVGFEGWYLRTSVDVTEAKYTQRRLRSELRAKIVAAWRCNNQPGGRRRKAVKRGK